MNGSTCTRARASAKRSCLPSSVSPMNRSVRCRLSSGVQRTSVSGAARAASSERTGTGGVIATNRRDMPKIKSDFPGPQAGRWSSPGSRRTRHGGGAETDTRLSSLPPNRERQVAPGAFPVGILVARDSRHADRADHPLAADGQREGRFAAGGGAAVERGEIFSGTIPRADFGVGERLSGEEQFDAHRAARAAFGGVVERDDLQALARGDAIGGVAAAVGRENGLVATLVAFAARLRRLTGALAVGEDELEAFFAQVFLELRRLERDEGRLAVVGDDMRAGVLELYRQLQQIVGLGRPVIAARGGKMLQRRDAIRAERFGFALEIHADLDGEADGRSRNRRKGRRLQPALVG